MNELSWFTDKELVIKMVKLSKNLKCKHQLFWILNSVLDIVRREQLLPRHGLFPSKKELYDHDFLQQPTATKLQISIVVMETCQKKLPN